MKLNFAKFQILPNNILFSNSKISLYNFDFEAMKLRHINKVYNINLLLSYKSSYMRDYNRLMLS